MKSWSAHHHTTTTMLNRRKLLQSVLGLAVLGPLSWLRPRVEELPPDLWVRAFHDADAFLDSLANVDPLDKPYIIMDRVLFERGLPR